MSGAVNYGRTLQKAETSAAWGDADADTESGAEPISTLCRRETHCGLCAWKGGPSAPHLQRAESSSDENPGAEGVYKPAAKRGPGHRTGCHMYLRDNADQACQIPATVSMCSYRFSGHCSTHCSILLLLRGGTGTLLFDVH